MFVVYLIVRLKICWLSSHHRKFPADIIRPFPSGRARVRT